MKRFISFFLAIICTFCFVSTASARLVGDVNSDGNTNSSDALMILQYAVGKITEINKEYADINDDGNINSGDALIVLKISVGNYDGDLEVDDNEDKTSYKKDVIDPILKSGEFTLKTEVTGEEGTNVVTTMMRGEDACVETKAKGRTVRLLVLDSKTYLIFPDFIAPGVNVYMKSSEQVDLSIGSAEDAEYIKSEEVTVDGEQLVCETYELKDGTVSNYYFKDGKWVMLNVTSDGETTTQKILDFKKGVDKSKFSLDDMIEIKA
ncbi:MAG: dockerin type I repeat-containing protein [Clostridia bacterium]|nr:dockerin type I repeat-containing protein [Clostridia bacterium]